MVIEKKTLELDSILWDAIDEQAEKKNLDRVNYIRQTFQDIVFKKPVKVTKILRRAYLYILSVLILILLILIYIRG